jgi:hypothetical protein
MIDGERGPAAAFRPLRDWAPTGFTWLLRMHAASMAGDAIVAVSLANTLFFSVPVGEARYKVAIYLLTTMLPFSVIAPFIGPMLDRTRTGRRLALAGTMAGRVVLVWLMATNSGALTLYPLALAVLVLSRGYAVARSAVVPRVLPRDTTLVGANARATLTGAVAGAVAAPLAAGVVHFADAAWALRLSAALFAAATVFALRLPPAINAEAKVAADATDIVGAPSRRDDAAVAGAAALRALAGFLTIFLAFRIKEDGGETSSLVILVAVAAIAGMAGTALGALARQHTPERLLSGSLIVASVALAFGAFGYDFRAAILGVGASGLCGSLSKLALDAMLQRDVVEHVRAQAFARSETALQLAWVIGGLFGLIPLIGGVGFGIAAVVVGAAAVNTMRILRTVPVA